LSLGRFGTKKKSVAELEIEFKDLYLSVNILDIYKTYLNEGQALIDNKDYIGILKVFNEKDLISRVSAFFGVTKPNYLDRARKMTRERDQKLITALSLYLPDFSNLG
jgi:hypothetical protein